jgi:hypothetical protein
MAAKAVEDSAITTVYKIDAKKIRPGGGVRPLAGGLGAASEPGSRDHSFAENLR